MVVLSDCMTLGSALNLLGIPSQLSCTCMVVPPFVHLSVKATKLFAARVTKFQP